MTVFSYILAWIRKTSLLPARNFISTSGETLYLKLSRWVYFSFLIVERGRYRYGEISLIKICHMLVKTVLNWGNLKFTGTGLA